MTIHQATTPADSSGNSTKDKDPYHPILQAYLADNNNNNNKLPSPCSAAAAATIASTTLSPPASGESLEDKLTHLWRLILDLATQNPAHQDKLVSLLTALSHLPDATARRADQIEDAKGPLTVHDMRVWQDLPMLGWEVRHRWNDSVPEIEKTEGRDAAIARIVNVNRFVARLVGTHEPVFRPHAWFALVTLRRALETPWEQMGPEDPLAAWVPAAAAWVEVLGAEIYGWEEEYAAGPGVGARGRGGPLWEGKHGFCPERWGLWRERFGEVAEMEGENEGVRSVALAAERRMKGVEAGGGGVDR